MDLEALFPETRVSAEASIKVGMSTPIAPAAATQGGVPKKSFAQAHNGVCVIFLFPNFLFPLSRGIGCPLRFLKRNIRKVYRTAKIISMVGVFGPRVLLLL